MICPSCGAPMQLKADQSSFKCAYCQSVYYPDQDDEGVRQLGEPSELSCPVCAVPMMHATLANQRIFSCTKCRGMLIPMQVFAEILDQLRSLQHGSAVQPAADKQDLRRRISCPKCHHPMEAHSYAGPGNVIMDTCDDCCFNWFDHGELSRIVRAPDERPQSFDAEDSEPEAGSGFADSRDDPGFHR